MKKYLQVIDDILNDGKEQQNRTGINSLALPNITIDHYMSEGFPLLTSRKMPWKSLRVELEGFLKGITSKKWYQDRGCKYWDYWANPYRVKEIVRKNYTYPETERISYEEYKKAVQCQTDDLGAIYPHQLRRFAEVYDENDDGVTAGFDQLAYIVQCLKTEPENRRLLVNYWNPKQISRQALPPCHYSWCVTIIGNEISLGFTMRSVDMMCGWPSNIAHYGLLLLLLAKEGGFVPYKLTSTLYNCHIYKNHINGAYEQVDRSTHKLPSVEIISRPDKTFSIFDWSYTDVKLNNYHHEAPIQFNVAI